MVYLPSGPSRIGHQVLAAPLVTMITIVYAYRQGLIPLDRSHHQQNHRISIAARNGAAGERSPRCGLRLSRITLSTSPGSDNQIRCSPPGQRMWNGCSWRTSDIQELPAVPPKYRTPPPTSTGSEGATFWRRLD